MELRDRKSLTLMNSDPLMTYSCPLKHINHQINILVKRSSGRLLASRYVNSSNLISLLLNKLKEEKRNSILKQIKSPSVNVIVKAKKEDKYIFLLVYTIL